MTRESKIGLLVGLSFIIAVGILLSDHLSTADEPTPASLQLAGSAVRSSLGQASGDPVASAVPTGLVGVPRSIAPSRPVALPDELAAARTRHAKPQAAPPPAVVAPPATDAPLPDTAMAFVPTPMAPVPPSANPDLIAAAERNGEPLVPATTARSGAASAGRTVVAEPGDSLGSLAERAYGSNTRSTRTALLAANPALKADPSRIVAGRSYAVGGDAPAAAAPTSKSPAAAGTVWYTVKQGDTLWSIAAGSPRVVDDIRKLNRDVLHDDKLRLNMRLRMPKSSAE